MDDDLGVQVRGTEPPLDVIRNLVRPDQAHIAIHFDMDLDKRGWPGNPSPQIMRGGNVGCALRDRADLLAFVIGQFMRVVEWWGWA